MQSSKLTGLILPLGSLFKVDTETFAQNIKDEYKPTPEQEKQILGLCYIFNLGALEPEKFKTDFCKTLNIPEKNQENFWKNWNSMLDCKGAGENLNYLIKQAEKNNILIVFTSDTNQEHTDEILRQVPDIKITIASDKQKLLNGKPFLTSYDLKKPRLELTKKALEILQSKDKEYKVESTKIIFGDPNNNKSQIFRERAEKELEATRSIAKDASPPAEVHLHSNTVAFTDMLTKVLEGDAPTIERRPTATT